MSARLEDYALIGDCETAALVGRDGSLDWLCLPRFDSAACFAALLGKPEHGRWLIAPREPVRASRRRYRDDTLILESELETEAGRVAVIDFMPRPRARHSAVVRIVEGRGGRVPMRLEFVLRFDYGSIVPWVRRCEGALQAIAGPDAVRVYTGVPTRGENLTTVAEFTVEAGQRIPFVVQWYPSHQDPPKPLDAEEALCATQRWWTDWAAQCKYRGKYREAVLRSLITLKALTYEPSGGIVAAPTTSLPERLGGVRNWDYRYCWIRDATFTLFAFLKGGYIDEARAWQEWLLRAVAGSPSQLNIMYGVLGNRRLTEVELDWLPGYEKSRPVHVGNNAWQQSQLDVFGELMAALHLARRTELQPGDYVWQLQKELAGYLEKTWTEPDDGIWEIRGPRRHFTHSKMMAWVAFDRMIKSAEQFHLEGPVAEWRKVRDGIHAQVCADGYDPDRNTFVQYYGGSTLDASLLMLPMVGFLPATDARVAGTVAAIEHDLLRDGLVQRYPTYREVDGLPPGEGAFLPCTFWLADNYQMMDRHDEAVAVFERLLALRNDVGLLSEEYDPAARRFLGNFPQAFSHITLVNTAINLEHPPAARAPAHAA